jgi:pimeloyl-ACP methyl ester carboxylesterase
MSLVFKGGRCNLHSLSRVNYNGEGARNLLCLPGFLGICEDFRWLFGNKEITQMCNVHALDMRNHGQSPHTDLATPQLMAEDVAQYIEDNQLRNVCVMGHSMGGKVTLQLAAEFPELLSAAMVLDIANYSYGDNNIFPFSFETYVMVKALNELPLHSMNYLQTKEAIERIAGNKMVAQFLMKNLKELDSGMGTINYAWRCNMKALADHYMNQTKFSADSNGSFEKPARVLIGEKSPYVPARLYGEYKKVFGNFDEKKDLKIIKNANHWVHFDKPTQFVEEVLDFLKEIWEK